jgi:hypothetical protein
VFRINIFLLPLSCHTVEARSSLPRCSIFDLRLLSPLNTAFDTRPALDDSDESPTSHSCKMPPGASHASYRLSEVSWGVIYANNHQNSPGMSHYEPTALSGEARCVCYIHHYRAKSLRPTPSEWPPRPVHRRRNTCCAQSPSALGGSSLPRVCTGNP